MKKEIKPEELTKNPFHMIGKEWMLVTAEKDGKVNTMTASWGGLGVMWGKNVAFVFIRPMCSLDRRDIPRNLLMGQIRSPCPFWVRSTERHCLIWEPYQVGMRIRSVNQDFM